VVVTGYSWSNLLDLKGLIQPKPKFWFHVSVNRNYTVIIQFWFHKNIFRCASISCIPTFTQSVCPTFSSSQAEQTDNSDRPSNSLSDNLDGSNNPSNHPTNQPTNQPINQSTNQPTNQKPTNQTIKSKLILNQNCS